MTRSTMLFLVGMTIIVVGALARKPWHVAAGAFAVLVAFATAP